MGGSPKTILVENSEKVYLKVEGYDSETNGTFGIKIDQLNKESATQIPTR